jgi:hypothetical protein
MTGHLRELRHDRKRARSMSSGHASTVFALPEAMPSGKRRRCHPD